MCEMKTQNELKMYQKTAKNLTLVTAILLTVVTFFSIVQMVYLIALRNTDLSQYSELTKGQVANIEASITNSTIFFFGAIALIYLIFTILMYVFRGKIKKGKKVMVLPYYGTAILSAYSFLQSVLAVNLVNAILYFATGMLAGIALFFVYKFQKESVAN